MPDDDAARAFMDDYRRTFERADVDAICALFAFPVQVVGEADGVTVAVVPSVDGWRPQIERVTGAYALLGVAGATIASMAVDEVTPGIAHATVTWSLARADGSPVYDFTASYTLADLPEGTRIVAIAHDETPKLLAAIASARAQ
jgi:hypothetical protein